MEKIKKYLKTKKFKQVLLVIITFLSLAVFCINLDMVDNKLIKAGSEISKFVEKWTYSLNGFQIQYILMFILFYYFYSKNYFDGKKMSKTAMILSIFFSIMMVLGYSYIKQNNWDLVFGSWFQFSKAFVICLGYYCIFYMIICRREEFIICMKAVSLFILYMVIV